MVGHDVKECDLLPGWCDLAQDRGAWWCLVREAEMEVNDRLETPEEGKSDE